MRTYMYLRKSRAEEFSDTIEDTLRRHKETLLAVAQKQSLNITAIYEEVVSGDSLYTRPEMLRMLSDIEFGECDAVLCMDIDRLGRGSMSQQGIILDTLKRKDVKIITPQKLYDLNDETDEDYTEFQTFFARRELKTIKKRMRRGIDKTAQEGGYLPNAPYGYSKTRIDGLPSLQIVEEEAKFIRMIFSMYADQGHGCQTIANALNSMGARPRRGADFGRTTVQLILRNPVYIGKIAWNRKQHKKVDDKTISNTRVPAPKEKHIIVDGKHQPIVSDEIFNRTQEIFQSRYHPPCQTGQIVNPLAGVITCSRCGGKMLRQPDKKGNGHIYLLCAKAGCMPSAHLEDVEAELLRQIRQKLAETELQIQTNANKHQDHSLSNSLALVENKISQLKQQRNRLHDLLEQDVYSIDTFLERSQALEKKLSNLLNTKENIEKQIESLKQNNIVALRDRVRNVLESYDAADSAERNRLLKTIVGTAAYYREREWPTSRFLLQVTLKPVK